MDCQSAERRQNRIFSGGSTAKYLPNTVLTHYRHEIRLEFITPSSLAPIGNQFGVNHHAHAIPHVQGVDTVLIPTKLIQYTPAVNANVVTEFLLWIFDWCPDSFYHDDYLFSMLVYIADWRVSSLWNGSSVAGHIDGVSKHNNQLHTHQNVFMREFATQRCIIDNFAIIRDFLFTKTDAGY